MCTLQQDVEAQHEQLLHDELPEEAAVSERVIVSSNSITSISSNASLKSFKFSNFFCF